MKKILPPIAMMMAAGFLIAAASYHEDLSSYWDAPAATDAPPPHEWSDLERNLSPESCAQCHDSQFDDWKMSLHAKAFSPGLIGQFPDMSLENANDCLNCHAPLTEQKFSNSSEINAALLKSLKQPEGFHADADIEKPALPLRHAGVTCAACHVRDWQRFGPPRTGDHVQGKMDGPSHGGFTASKRFEQSQFCASCHQFSQEYAINGKPMENTLTEWKQSRFAREGVQCQTCHMPDRKHAFRGIHDPVMVRKGLEFRTTISGKSATLELESVWIGHAFPTYVTPKVLVHISAEDSHGRSMGEKSWEISRVVRYEDGWKEISDTRLMPGEKRMFALSPLPEGSRVVRFKVDVIPDHFYKGVYRDLVAGEQTPDAQKLIRRAGSLAEQNDYRLFEQTRAMP